MKANKREVDEFLGRIEKQVGAATVSVCADCTHSSPARKRSKWVCLARPIRRDIVDGQWLYTRCAVANDGDCDLFELKLSVEPAKQVQRKTEQPEPSWWSRFRRRA